MNKICTSIEQSKKLIELGINTNTADFMWEYNPDKETYWTKPTIIPIDDYIFINDIPAWSLSALLGCKYVRKGYTSFDWTYEQACEAAIKYCLENLI